MDELDKKLAALGERAPLFYHLGEFALSFSALEKFFHIIFDRLSGFERKISRAVAGGMRLPDLINLLSRLYQARETDQQYLDEFKILIQQIDDISKFRHKLIHVGVGGVDPNLISANPTAAKTLEPVEYWKFQLADIKAATSDIERIIMRLQMLTSLNFSIAHLVDYVGGRADLYAPWRYKRIEPTRPS
jgi:hypothetical protein